jgi:hypothetical protein
MASAWEQSVQDAAQKLADAIRNAAELRIDTIFTEPATANQPQKDLLTLSSTFQPDGDSSNQVPVQVTPAGVVADPALYQIHLQNVNAAIAYRKELLSSLLSALQSRL